MQDILLAPSILAANFGCLAQEVTAVCQAGADYIHFDVMDNHYVPNLSVGPMVCRALRDAGIKAPIDVHLMVKPVDRMIRAFAEAGASLICFHADASDDVLASMQLVKSLGCQVGLALNPGQSPQQLPHAIDFLDLLLVMGVNPGFGGQKLLPETYGNLRLAREWVLERGLQAHVGIDGGVTLENVGQLAEAGANFIVAGSAIFGTSDYAQRCHALRQACQSSALT